MIRHAHLSLSIAALTMFAGTQSPVYASEPVGELARVTGTAVVSQGAQYVVGREGLPLHENDRLLVLEGGSALVLFADGCRYSLQDDELLVVPAVSTCASQAVVHYKTEPYAAIHAGPSISGGDLTLAQVGGGLVTAAGGSAGGAISGALVAATVATTSVVAAAVDSNSGSSGSGFPPPPSP